MSKLELIPMSGVPKSIIITYVPPIQTMEWLKVLMLTTTSIITTTHVIYIIAFTVVKVIFGIIVVIFLINIIIWFCRLWAGIWPLIRGFFLNKMGSFKTSKQRNLRGVLDQIHPRLIRRDSALLLPACHEDVLQGFNYVLLSLHMRWLTFLFWPWIEVILKNFMWKERFMKLFTLERRLRLHRGPVLVGVPFQVCECNQIGVLEYRWLRNEV